MPTGPIDSWASSPETLGAIYPFVGYEGIMVAGCAAFWLAWTVWQLRMENAEYKRMAEAVRETHLSTGAKS